MSANTMAMPCSTSLQNVGRSTKTPFTSSAKKFAGIAPSGRFGRQFLLRGYKVEIEHKGETHELDVPEGVSVLEAALDNGLDLPHDCKLGVCMTCPARLVSGEVDQSGSMLSDDVAEKGYALLCVSMPESDCKFKTIGEDEVLDEALQTSQF